MQELNLFSALDKALDVADFLEPSPRTTLTRMLPTETLTINYSFSESRFGTVLVASTEKGICYLAYEEDVYEAVINLKEQWPKAHLVSQTDEFHLLALSWLQHPKEYTGVLPLHVKGTYFQFLVWQQLLAIPFGHLLTYSSVGVLLQKKNAARAIGTAIGMNLIAYIIPCHRVVPANGTISGYRWGPERKKIILEWEYRNR